MLYVVFNFVPGDSNVPIPYLPWHVGERIHQIVKKRIDEVVSVQADSDELEWVRENIEGIPYCKGKRVQTWYGDHAKFIANCLPVKH